MHSLRDIQKPFFTYSARLNALSKGRPMISHVLNNSSLKPNLDSYNGYGHIIISYFLTNKEITRSLFKSPLNIVWIVICTTSLNLFNLLQNQFKLTHNCIESIFHFVNVRQEMDFLEKPSLNSIQFLSRFCGKNLLSTNTYLNVYLALFQWIKQRACNIQIHWYSILWQYSENETAYA